MGAGDIYFAEIDILIISLPVARGGLVGSYI